MFCSKVQSGLCASALHHCTLYNRKDCLRLQIGYWIFQTSTCINCYPSGRPYRGKDRTCPFLHGFCNVCSPLCARLELSIQPPTMAAVSMIPAGSTGVGTTGTPSLIDCLVAECIDCLPERHILSPTDSCTSPHTSRPSQ